MTKRQENNHPQAGIFTSATSLSQPPRSLFGVPRLLSVGIHIMLIVVALIPWTSAPVPRPKFTETSVALYTPARLTLNITQVAGRSGGGGGGGKRQPRPASFGQIPRPADKQFVPPDPEPPKNPKPELVMEPTIVAHQLAQLPQLTLLNIGDPNGVPGPPSSGPGQGGGIGNNGKGRGIGDDEGPGLHDGKNGGYGGQPARISGNVTPPTVVYRVEPEYSEEARKARYEGTVLLEAIVRKDGSVDVVHIVRSLGFGLDQNAMQALKQWRFRPARQNGVPVDVSMRFEVNFNLR